MKTSTMILIGLAGVGAYLAYKASTAKTFTVIGWKGAPKTITADDGVTDAQIAQIQQAWTVAGTTDDVAGLQAIITQQSAAGHPKIANGLQAVYSEALAHQNDPVQPAQLPGSATAGYSAGSLRTLQRIPMISQPLERAHRLAMLGRI